MNGSADWQSAVSQLGKLHGLEFLRIAPAPSALRA